MLLVKPASRWTASKHLGVWSIPKGSCEEGESPLSAAQREFHEETGMQPIAPYLPLGSVVQARKTLAAWAFDARSYRASLGVANAHRGGVHLSIEKSDEIAAVAWFTLEDAACNLVSAQQALLTQLTNARGKRSATDD